jgi:hypothetical protein
LRCFDRFEVRLDSQRTANLIVMATILASVIALVAQMFVR